MAEMNMNNQFDQKSETTVEYIGRKFDEFSMIYMETKEDAKNFLVGTCQSIMGLMPDWLQPVLEVTSDFWDFALDVLDANARRLPGAMLGALMVVPIITNPQAMEVAVAGGGTTRLSTGAVVVMGAIIGGSAGGGGGNNESETFRHRDSGEKKPKKLKPDPPKKISLREKYLGRTPGKASRTGREVIERMKEEGTLIIDEQTKKITFKASNGKWYNIEEADMAHRTDAVSWWNQTGRFYGAKSKEVRKWMLDSKNYTLDHYSLNRSEGAKLDENYLPPIIK